MYYCTHVQFQKSAINLVFCLVKEERVVDTKYGKYDPGEKPEVTLQSINGRSGEKLPEAQL